jgi:hypothetical protein
MSPDTSGSASPHRHPAKLDGVTSDTSEEEQLHQQQQLACTASGVSLVRQRSLQDHQQGSAAAGGGGAAGSGSKGTEIRRAASEQDPGGPDYSWEGLNVEGKR